jgi:uncharacterized protein YodC (DUF2158 family)
VKLKIGDTVMLRSGGPSMTVERLPSFWEPEILCSWFFIAGRTFGPINYGRFPVDTLIPASPTVSP